MVSPARRTPYREESPAPTEYQTGVGGNNADLSYYTVPESVHGLSLRAPHLAYYGVVKGTAIVRADGEEERALRVGDSLVVPPLQTIRVDYPEADETPVRYVVFKVDREEVQGVLERIADGSPAESSARGWHGDDRAYCRIERREGVNRILNMVSYLFREDPPNRDRLLDLNAMELIIQLLQTRSRALLLGEFPRTTSAGGLAAAVQYIQDNLDRHISIDELVDKACMSKSSFYRHFSEEFDMSPLEYITRERIVRARELLSDPENTVTTVSHALGFSSTSHFIDTFKEHEGITPKQYQLDVTD